MSPPRTLQTVWEPQFAHKRACPLDAFPFIVMALKPFKRLRNGKLRNAPISIAIFVRV
jgi:hypothetical protein